MADLLEPFESGKLKLSGLIISLIMLLNACMLPLPKAE